MASVLQRGMAWCVVKAPEALCLGPKQLSCMGNKRMQSAMPGVEQVADPEDAEPSSERKQYSEKYVNQTMLLGRVGGVPEKRGTGTASAMIFPLATQSNYRSANGDLNSQVQWHRVVVFKPYLQTSIEQYVHKGARVLVNGTINYSDYVGQDNIKHKQASIIANEVILMSNTRKPGEEPSN